MIEGFAQWARAEYDPEYVPPGNPKYDFGGLHGVTDAADPDDLREMYRAWWKHGIMATAGGYLDQPEWWHRDMKIARSMFNVLGHQVMAEVKARKPKPNA